MSTATSPMLAWHNQHPLPARALSTYPPTINIHYQRSHSRYARHSQHAHTQYAHSNMPTAHATATCPQPTSPSIAAVRSVYCATCQIRTGASHMADALHGEKGTALSPTLWRVPDHRLSHGPVLRPFRSQFLLSLHADNGFKHGIDRGNALGVGLESALRRDHLYKFRGHVHVGLFDIVGSR